MSRGILFARRRKPSVQEMKHAEKQRQNAAIKRGFSKKYMRNTAKMSVKRKITILEIPILNDLKKEKEGCVPIFYR